MSVRGSSVVRASRTSISLGVAFFAVPTASFLYYNYSRPDCYDGSTPTGVVVAWFVGVGAAAALGCATFVAASPRSLSRVWRYALALTVGVAAATAMTLAIIAAWPGFC
jgi:hypothetical protein